MNTEPNEAAATPEPAAPAWIPPTPEKKAFLAALALAQGKFPPIARERTVKIETRDKGTYTFRYAELATILAAVRPALAENGLSLRSRILPAQQPGRVWLQSILGHSEGYEDLVEMQIDASGDIKTFGGLLTYMRRYMQSAQLGIASEDDDDEDGTGAGSGAGSLGTGGRAPSTASTAKSRPQANAPRLPAGAPAQAQSPGGPPAEPPAGAELVSKALGDWIKNTIECIPNLPGSEALGLIFDAAHAPRDTPLHQLTKAQANAIKPALQALLAQ